MIKVINRIKEFTKTTWFRYTVILFFGIFLGEMIFRLCAKMPIFSYPSLRIMISTLLLSTFIGYLLSFCGKIAARIIIGVVIFATNFYAYLQLGFNNFLGVYMSFGTSSQLGAVVDYIKDFLHSIKYVYYTCYIPFVLVLIYLILFEKKLYNNDRNNVPKMDKQYKFYIKTINLVGVVLGLIVLYYLTLSLKFMQNDLQLTPNKKLIVNPSVPSTAIQEFGTTLFCLDDIKITLFPKDEALAYERKSNKSNNSGSHINPDYKRVIDDTAWEKVIANEKRSTYNTLNNYTLVYCILPTNGPSPFSKETFFAP